MFSLFTLSDYFLENWCKDPHCRAELSHYTIMHNNMSIYPFPLGVLYLIAPGGIKKLPVSGGGKMGNGREECWM